jgi:hypothetical protein
MAKVTYMAKEIMSPSHEKWYEFVAAMMMEFGGCESTHKTARAVLQEIQGIDVDGTLEFFESQEGICDCEVLLNVVAGNLPRDHQQVLIDSWIKEVQGDER